MDQIGKFITGNWFNYYTTNIDIQIGINNIQNLLDQQIILDMDEFSKRDLNILDFYIDKYKLYDEKTLQQKIRNTKIYKKYHKPNTINIIPMFNFIRNRKYRQFVIEMHEDSLELMILITQKPYFYIFNKKQLSRK